MRCARRPALVLFLALAAGRIARAQSEELPPPRSALPSYPPGVVDVTPDVIPGHAEPLPWHCEPAPPFLVSVEYLLVRPRRRDLDFAAIDPRDDLIPQGPLVSLDWQTRSGIRTEILWRPEGGANDLAFTHTYIYSRDSAVLAAPNGGLLYATLTRPGIVDEVNRATAFS